MNRGLAVLLCGLVLTLAACHRSSINSEQSVRPNILLVTIDTFRADRLTADVTPTLIRLASTGIRFTSARTAAPLTLPSHATIMTGLLPPAHGVSENGVGRLSDRHATIASLLKSAGYQTAAFVGAFVLDRRFGLALGFDTYDDRIPRDPAATDRLEAERPASAVVDQAIAWLNMMTPAPVSRAAGSPFFLWIHLYDPHAPYHPPAQFLARAKNPYDGEVMYADSQVARVIDWLRDRGVRDRTLTVVAGDHGEGLGDHGEQTHGMLLYDSTLRVPLVIVPPSTSSRAHSWESLIDAPVSLVDVAPTILRAAAVMPPLDMQGRDLLSDAALGSNSNISVRLPPDLEIYAETDYPGVAGWSPLQALTDGRWKMIRNATGAEVYDLQNDIREQRNLAGEQARIVQTMSSRIDLIRKAGKAIATSGGASAPTPGISNDVRERLGALGYVAASPQPTSTAGAPNPAAVIADWNRFESALSMLNEKRSAATGILERLAREYPSAPVFQSTYARALKESGQHAAALAVYRKAIERWPADSTLRHDFAVAAREAAGTGGDPAATTLREEAVRADRAAVAASPDNAAAHNGLGLLAVDADRPDEAIREFERATALDPDNATYWTNLGNALRAGRGSDARLKPRAPDSALAAYQRALAIDPQSVDALNGTGVVLVEANRAGEAVPWLERAVAASPDFVEARLNLGIALQQSGQPARAVEAYRAVLAAAGHSRERQAAQKLLKTLGEQ